MGYLKEQPIGSGLTPALEPLAHATHQRSPLRRVRSKRLLDGGIRFNHSHIFCDLCGIEEASLNLFV